jgi:hypothetical protein
MNDGYDFDGGLGVLPGTTYNADPSSAWPIAGDFGIAEGDGTGRFGVTPGPGGVAGTASDAVTGVWEWLNHPFTSRMSPVNVFLLVGIIIIAGLVWNLVLYHIRIAAEAI